MGEAVAFASDDDWEFAGGVRLGLGVPDALGEAEATGETEAFGATEAVVAGDADGEAPP